MLSRKGMMRPDEAKIRTGEAVKATKQGRRAIVAGIKETGLREGQNFQCHLIL